MYSQTVCLVGDDPGPTLRARALADRCVIVVKTVDDKCVYIGCFFSLSDKNPATVP